jgi:hypothetical protein
MHVERFDFGSGETGRYFVIPGRSMSEIFSARLMDGSSTLRFDWTASLGIGTVVNRLARVQGLAGGPGSFTRVEGYASDRLRELIQALEFNKSEVERALGLGLGGEWRIGVTPKPNSVPPTWTITATRIG